MADKPITRKELFLAKAGGQDVKTPEPITREERFLAAIAQGGGSGGGSGLPEITVTHNEILAEQSFAFADGGGMYISNVGELTLSVGDAVEVAYDGTTYSQTAADFNGYVYLGNLGLAGGANTGEPFLIVNAFAPPAYTCIASDTNASHTVGISQNASNPAAGSILMVKDGAWESVALREYLPIFTMIHLPSGSNVAAGAGVIITGTASDLGSIPDSWSGCISVAGSIADDGGNLTELIMSECDVSGSSVTLNVYNPTSSAVDLTAGLYIRGVFFQL